LHLYIADLLKAAKRKSDMYKNKKAAVRHHTAAKD